MHLSGTKIVWIYVPLGSMPLRAVESERFDSCLTTINDQDKYASALGITLLVISCILYPTPHARGRWISVAIHNMRGGPKHACCRHEVCRFLLPLNPDSSFQSILIQNCFWNTIQTHTTAAIICWGSSRPFVGAVLLAVHTGPSIQIGVTQYRAIHTKKKTSL
jgi:hypothetical protein